MKNCKIQTWCSVLAAALITSQFSPAAFAQAAPATQAGAQGTSLSQGEMAQETLALPTGERDTSVLLLERSAPKQVRVGQASPSTIKVTNLTNNPLGQVVVAQTLGQGVQIQSSQPKAQPAPGSEQQATGSLQIVQWQLGSLPANESRTIQVTSIASQLGSSPTCMWASYFPAICAVTEVVQPNLELATQLIGVEGEGITVCEQPTIQYTVRNSGTGIAQDVNVVHPLPEGLTSVDGQTTVTLPVGDLSAGQEKQVTAQVKAARTGTFTSRAYAKSATDDAYSSPVQLMVSRPVLDIKVAGPDQVILGEQVQYNVTIRNTGDAPVTDAVLALNTEGIAASDRNRNIGSIQPGESKVANVVVRQTGRDSVDLAVAVRATCAEEASSSATTKIQTLAALRLEMIDNVDPVKVGENTVYEISVKNQGNGPATNVTLAGALPQQLQFVEGSGTTQVTAQGNQLTFGAVTSIAPGDVATWYVTAKGVTAGDARIKLDMNSDYLDKPVTEQEPTRVY